MQGWNLIKNECPELSFKKASMFTLYIPTFRSFISWGGEVIYVGCQEAHKGSREGWNKQGRIAGKVAFRGQRFTGAETLQLCYLTPPHKKMDFKTTTCE